MTYIMAHFEKMIQTMHLQFLLFQKTTDRHRIYMKRQALLEGLADYYSMQFLRNMEKSGVK